MAIPNNSIKTSSGKGRSTIDWPRYQKSAHIDIVSSKGILVTKVRQQQKRPEIGTPYKREVDKW